MESSLPKTDLQEGEEASTKPIVLLVDQKTAPLINSERFKELFPDAQNCQTVSAQPGNSNTFCNATILKTLQVYEIG